MTHWFHRNPFKATNPQSFDVRKISMKSDFSKVISDLRTARNALLALFNNQASSPDKMDEASAAYFALVQGLFHIPQNQGQEQSTSSMNQGNKETDKEKDNKEKSDAPAGAAKTLNTFFKFKWTQTLFVGKPPLVANDAEFDFINMGINVALWYTKHAAKLAAHPEISMEDAKEIHTCLKKAAGIFKEFKDNHVGLLSNPPEKCSDTDTMVLDCYIMCCQAEAQEVTIARAVEKKHKARLIAGLANETSKYFHMADDYLKSHDQEIVGKWRKYLQLKQAFYRSYALCYYGDALLSQEKCGDSIRCLQDSTEAKHRCKTAVCCQLKAMLDRHIHTIVSFITGHFLDYLTELAKASALCKQYISTKGAGSTIRPHEHEFYRNFEKNLHRKFEKSKSENGFIYHQKVPAVPPNMDLQATHGLVDPTPYAVPSTSEKWTSLVYAGFNISKNVKDDKKHDKQPEKDGEVQPVKEPDIKVTKDSGCTVS